MRIRIVFRLLFLLLVLALPAQGADTRPNRQSPPEKRSVRSVFQELDAIKLNEFEIEEPTPLANVVQRLNLEIRKHDPDLSDLAIRIVPSPVGEAKTPDLNTVMLPKMVPALRDVSIIQVLGVASRFVPLDAQFGFTIKENGVEIFPWNRDVPADMHESPAREPRWVYLDIEGSYGYGGSFWKQVKIKEGARFMVTGNIRGGGSRPILTQLTLSGQVGFIKDKLIPFVVVTEAKNMAWGTPRLIPLNMPYAYGGGGAYSASGASGPSTSISIWTDPPPGQEPDEAPFSREAIDWERRVKAISPGSKRAEVEFLLPRYSDPVLDGQMSLPKVITFSGGKTSEVYWVDKHWRVAVGYNYEDRVTSIKLEEDTNVYAIPKLDSKK